MKLFAFILLSFVAATQALLPPPPKDCKISWDSVTRKSFEVTWDTNRFCKKYIVALLEGYTETILTTYSQLDGNSFVVDNLQELTHYGVQVSCTDRKGETSFPSEICRIKTMGDETSQPPSTPAPTGSPPVGSCGPNKFTCETDPSECISADLWCNKNNDCRDGTDERNCPGHCEEITSFHDMGTYSCTRWNSRNSVCQFECEEVHWELAGPWHVTCLGSGWSNAPPSCRLRPPIVDVIENGVYRRKIKMWIETDPEEAQKVLLVSLVDMTRSKDIGGADFYLERDIDGYLVGVVNRLRMNTSYKIVLAVQDRYGVRSKGSEAVIGRTSANWRGRLERRPQGASNRIPPESSR